MALFPPTTMYMGLKLLIIICQNCESQDTMDVLRSVLTDDLLTRSFSMDAGICKDQKLSEIGLYLKGLIY